MRRNRFTHHWNSPFNRLRVRMGASQNDGEPARYQFTIMG